MKKLMIGMFLLLSVTCEAATIRGTVVGMSVSSIDVVYGVGEALRLAHVKIDDRTSIRGLELGSRFRLGDVVEVEGTETTAKTSLMADHITKCRLNELELVVSCP